MQNSKERIVIKVLKDYKLALKMVDLYEKGNLYITNKLTIQQISDFYYEINYIDCVIEQLDEVSKNFIINQYVKKSDFNWWMDLYSKSTFYRHKKNAIDDFIEYYNSRYNFNYLQ